MTNEEITDEQLLEIIMVRIAMLKYQNKQFLNEVEKFLTQPNEEN